MEDRWTEDPRVKAIAEALSAWTGESDLIQAREALAALEPPKEEQGGGYSLAEARGFTDEEADLVERLFEWGLSWDGPVRPTLLSAREKVMAVLRGPETELTRQEFRALELAVAWTCGHLPHEPSSYEKRLMQAAIQTLMGWGAEDWARARERGEQ